MYFSFRYIFVFLDVCLDFMYALFACACSQNKIETLLYLLISIAISANSRTYPYEIFVRGRIFQLELLFLIFGKTS